MTYPACITKTELCSSCYNGESQTCSTSSNAGSGCATCNSACQTAQNYCSVNQAVSHWVGVFPMTGCQATDEFIHRGWKASEWNATLKKLADAAALGELQSQGTIPTQITVAADPDNTSPHPAGSLITAAAYNSLVDSINHFNRSVGKVSAGDVIRASHALALKNGYNSATFNTNVCDVCNAGGQSECACNCSCSCSCDCNCGCSCSCSCSNPCPCANPNPTP